MSDNKLDALVTPSASVAPVLANGAFPGINVSSGYDGMGVPFGIKGKEPQLIQIASGFEQATKIRKRPTFSAGKTSRETSCFLSTSINNYLGKR
ncbi:hypothetical protein Peur_052250 [Populus x canadensis]|jgi:amidase|uniref:Amidase domain-containing protein n=1 Tax=Populus deltoides TaxID=3696 RepID=A0A8T2YZZ9_POPDE|nr:hypothetical protein H0E87_008216 [Populus deltoides]